MTTPRPSGRLAAACGLCGAPLDANELHLTEAFEATGQLLCEPCWERVCEDDSDDEDGEP